MPQLKINIDLKGLSPKSSFIVETKVKARCMSAVMFHLKQQINHFRQKSETGVFRAKDNSISAEQVFVLFLLFYPWQMYDIIEI